MHTIKTLFTLQQHPTDFFLYCFLFIFTPGVYLKASASGLTTLTALTAVGGRTGADDEV